MKVNLKRYIEAVSAALAVVGLYGVLHILGIGCPIKYITGISCAGCGMTRAWLELLHGNISNAFYYHPLFLLPPVALASWMLKPKINRKIYQTLVLAGVILFIAVYVYRMLAGLGDIVVFEPWNGFFIKTVQRLISV